MMVGWGWGGGAGEGAQSTLLSVWGVARAGGVPIAPGGLGQTHGTS